MHFEKAGFVQEEKEYTGLCFGKTIISKQLLFTREMYLNNKTNKN